MLAHASLGQTGNRRAKGRLAKLSIAVVISVPKFPSFPHVKKLFDFLVVTSTEAKVSPQKIKFLTLDRDSLTEVSSRV